MKREASLPWLRLFTATPSDPKLRLVARESGQPVASVLAVWVTMLCHAGERPAHERGQLQGWLDGIAGVNLDLPTNVVASIRNAMEDLLIREGRIIAWERRQATSVSTERVRAHRDRKRAEAETKPERLRLDETRETVSSVSETHETRRGEERRGEEKEHSQQPALHPVSPGGAAAPDAAQSDPPGGTGGGASKAPKATRLPPDWAPTEELLNFASSLGLCGQTTAEAFRDYWYAEVSPKARKLDWGAAFRSWCRREVERGPGGQRGPTLFPPRDTAANRRTGSVMEMARILGKDRHD